MLDDLFTYWLDRIDALPDRRERVERGDPTSPGSRGRRTAGTGWRCTTARPITRCSRSRGRRQLAQFESLAEEGEAPDRFRHGQARIAGAQALVCRTGYTGEDGVELLVAPGDAAGGVGRAHRRRRGALPGSAHATRCDWRSATRSTATTSRPRARRSRPGSNGPARSTRTSSAPSGCAGRRSRAPRRSWRRSSSPDRASRAPGARW